MEAPTDLELHALARRVADRMLETGRQMVAAESCTGGWVAKACTDLPGSSRWFRGGAVAYSNALKRDMLGVREATLEAEGAVSEAAVREMATGALARLGGDVAVAVSGIAGPDGGTPDKPTGTVWFAWAVGNAGRIDVATALERFDGDRDSVRRRAVAAALAGLLRE
jgi:nicotinamide-nucleotide amidase